MSQDQQLTHGEPARSLDFKVLGESVRDSYQAIAAQYRKDDEIEITSEFHRHVSSVLGNLSGTFGRPISVLDVGCGTGRYFHCLKNVRQLVGIDLSEEMLKIAKNPVRGEAVGAREILLRTENVHIAAFPSASFDLIYSLGMFGNGCPVTVELCNRFYDWLAPGGQLFFNVVSLATMPLSRRLRRSIRTRIYPFLPQRLKNALDVRNARMPFFGLAKRDLVAIMRASRFSDFSVSSRACQSPLWRGVHLECTAAKPRIAGK